MAGHLQLSDWVAGASYNPINRDILKYFSGLGLNVFAMKNSDSNRTGEINNINISSKDWLEITSRILKSVL